MNAVVEQLIEEQKPKTDEEYFQILREAVQQIILLGLWRSKFYEHAAFFGGTALRILYGLPRFSEGLDFSLLSPNPSFSISLYRKALIDELTAYQFEVEFYKKTKNAEIDRAFIEGNSQIHLAKINPGLRTQHNRKILVKIEVELNPPITYQTETKRLFSPIPFSVKTLALPELFAGKLCALLFREWKNNVKGRDWFDLLWFIGKKVPVRLAHLEKRMIANNYWSLQEGGLTLKHLKTMMRNKIEKLHLDVAKKDVARFLKNPSDLDAWDKTFFLEATEALKDI